MKIHSTEETTLHFLSILFRKVAKLTERSTTKGENYEYHI